MPRKTAAAARRRPDGGRASMRPRPDAAENRAAGPRATRRSAGFNEAAARCRGKLRRPGRGRTRRPCFNEAAARCRGKPAEAAPAPSADSVLQ